MFFFLLRHRHNRRMVSCREMLQRWLQHTNVSERSSFAFHSENFLKLDHLALSLLVTSQFKMLASLDGQLFPEFAGGAFHSQNNFLCCFSLFVENRLGLPTISTLLPIVSSLTLSIQGSFASLVLCHLVVTVLSALLAESSAGLRDIDHFDTARRKSPM